ncbi:hypothetical protein [Desulfofundulus sp.]|uniref:hypothetical protein n=1 Tax=Desulfofundulus sp. TaxID=2282750 RepID=UPI003C77D5F9
MTKTAVDWGLLIKLARGYFRRYLTLRECEILRRWKLQAMTWSGYDLVETRGKEDACNGN